VLVRSHRRHQLAIGPGALWRTLSDVGRYQAWWPWLRRFDADALAPGEVWSCEVRPPTGYAVRFAVALHEVRPAERISASISGDIAGTAQLEMAALGTTGGTEVELVSELGPNSRWLSGLALVAGPIVRYGHDWVLDRGLDQFLAQTSTPSPQVTS
jgi:uncharacterized protein YndB with AHSA1/START domain